MTDAEIAKALGFREQGIDVVFQVMERSGFPKRDKYFPNYRYWPAVKAYFDEDCALGKMFVIGGLADDGDMRW
jgi:hypothetical protein